MAESNQLTFLKGLKDGLPIALGYLSVSFTFGILVVSYGLDIWVPILTSLSNFTGTGQFIGMEMLKDGSALLEIAFTMVIINIRYVLMSISMSQKMENGVGFGKRLMISFGVTDEVYAVSMSQDGELNFKYLMGLMLGSFVGWMSGTTLGALAGSIIPAVLISAMGITIYGMFIAIIVPPAKDSRPVLITVLIALIISCILYLIPVLRENNFYIIIIAGIISTLVVTFMFPIHDEVDTHSEIEYETIAENISDNTINVDNVDNIDDNINNVDDIASTTKNNDVSPSKDVNNKEGE